MFCRSLYIFRLAIVLSVLPLFTASDYLFGIFCPLYYLSSLYLQLLITPLVSSGHCIVLLWFTASDYLFGIFWPLYCLYFFDLRLLITPLVSCGHCIACTSLIYGFRLPLWYLLVIALPVLLWFTASDYPFGIFWPLHCLYFFDLRLLITFLVSYRHCIACTSLIYGFWLPLWYLLAIALPVLLWLTASDYLFGIFWSLHCLFLFDLRILITSLYHWPLYCLYFFHLRLLITSLVSFGHCIVYTSLIYGFWLPLWYLLAIVLPVLLWFTASDYPWYLLAIVLPVLLWFTASDYLFGIFWPLYCLSRSLFSS